MGFDETRLKEVNALSAGPGDSSAGKGDAGAADGAGVSNRLVAQAVAERHAEQPKSYLDVALGTVITNQTVERHVAEAAKTGAMFFRGKAGLATTVALYALDQVKVGDSFGQAVTDIGLGALKGTALRGINTSAATRDIGIVGQAAALGVSSRVLDSGLNRTTWMDAKTGAFNVQQGTNKLIIEATNREALATEIGAFAIGGSLAGGINKVTEGALRSSALWKTTMTGGVFGLATGGTNEVRRQQDAGEKFDLTKVMAAGGTQFLFSAAAMIPAGAQAGSRLRHTFTESHGVTTLGEGGMYKFGFRANGGVTELFQVPASNRGLKEAKGRLDALSESGQVDLANSFGISFAKHGERVSFDVDGGKHTVEARAPRLNELTAMREALTKSQPGQLTLDGQTGMKFNFLRDADAAKIGFGGLFEFHGKTPNVFLHNEISQNKPLTARDRDPMPYDDGRRRGSLEQTATHEIGHHTDMKVRGQDPQLEASIRKELGWVKYRDGELDFSTHLLEAKDGSLYKYNYGRTWTRSDAHGNPLDAAGNPAAPGKEYVLSNEDMMRQSKVPPISDYFNNPTEMLMEGFKEFRVGGENRAGLLRFSPVLYEQVVRQDNRELALQYGSRPDGQSALVRLPDGTLAKRDAESAAMISQFENESLSRTGHYDVRYQL